MVRAASSLRQPLQTVASELSEGEVELIFSSSSHLARQVQAGAPADLVVVADRQWLDQLVLSGLAVGSTRVGVATNGLVVGVPAAGVTRPTSLDDLSDHATLAVARPEVPVGTLARQALTQAGALARLEPTFVQTTSATATVALVASGEVDAGLMYRSDALGEPRVHLAFEVPDSRALPYEAALTPTGRTNPAAREVLANLQSPAVQARLGRSGLGPPDADSPPAGPTTVPLADPHLDLWGPVWRSLWMAVLAVLLITPPALAAGTWLARSRLPGKWLVSTVLLLPLVLPPVVTGYGLLALFGRNGWLAPVLNPLGLDLAFSRWAAVVAAAVVGFPLLILMVRGAIEAVDPRYEQISRTLGRGRWSTWVRVTLPLALPGLAAGWVLAFARALGEFGATAIFAGDRPTETRTLALAVYALYEQPGGAASAAWLAGISVVLCLAALVGYERLNAWQRRRVQDR